MNTLLVVEDEADLRMIIVETMQEEGIKVIEAENGKQAIELLLGPQGSEISAVLTDIKMPKMDGLSMVRELRNKGYDTPVIILSGYGDKEKTVEALRLGVYDFQDKPFDPEPLVASVKAAVAFGDEIRGLHREVEGILDLTSYSGAEREKYKESLKQLLMFRKNRKVNGI